MYQLRQVLTPADEQRAAALLRSQGLELPEDVECGFGLYAGESIVGTGFYGHGRIMGLCVDEALRGQGHALTLVDHLLKEALQRGQTRAFIFTKAGEAQTFAAAGFDLLATVPDGAALLEWGRPGFAAWLEGVRRKAGQVDGAGVTGVVGAVVLNANPCTRGHLSLLERAAAQCARLYAFVVEEEASAFPFATRLALVRKNAADIKNCCVLPGGPYIISRGTFPTYFTGKEAAAPAHAALDAALFASRIAPALCITRRFVGTEPLSPVTALYNAALTEILPRHGVAVEVLPRLEDGGEVISASRVRALLKEGKIKEACFLVPAATAVFLRSEQGGEVIRALQKSGFPLSRE